MRQPVKLTCLILFALVYLAVGCEPSDPSLATIEAKLSGEQCDYFAVDGKTQICHATASATHPYTILNVSEDACVAAHSDHAGDYIAVDDPTCGGGGCLPTNAPCDATLPCCDGLACVGGTCQAPQCPCDDHYATAIQEWGPLHGLLVEFDSTSVQCRAGADVGTSFLLASEAFGLGDKTGCLAFVERDGVPVVELFEVASDTEREACASSVRNLCTP